MPQQKEVQDWALKKTSDISYITKKYFHVYEVIEWVIRDYNAVDFLLVIANL